MNTTTIGELAAKVTGGNERAMRKLLNDAARAAGGLARFDEYAENPSEPVPLDLVFALAALRAQDAAGRRVITFLRDNR